MRVVLTIILAVAAATLPALAHVGTGSGIAMLDGLAHPLLGPDHLLAMIGVGLWAGVTGGNARWLWPLAFVAMMAIGGIVALAGINLPHVEAIILASIIGIGAALAWGTAPPVAIGAALCGLFAIAHGHAHGTELPLGVSAAGYVAGFMLATAALHAGGLALGLTTRRNTAVTRILGVGISATGAALSFI